MIQDKTPGISLEEQERREAKRLSPSTEVWLDAAIKAGNRADEDPEFAKAVGARLY